MTAVNAFAERWDRWGNTDGVYASAVTLVVGEKKQFLIDGDDLDLVLPLTRADGTDLQDGDWTEVSFRPEEDVSGPTDTLANTVAGAITVSPSPGQLLEKRNTAKTLSDYLRVSFVFQWNATVGSWFITNAANMALASQLQVDNIQADVNALSVNVTDHYVVCDSDEDLQTKINEVNTVAGRGKIWLSGHVDTGIHEITEQIDVPGDVEICGRGPGRSILRVSDAAVASTQWLRMTTAGAIALRGLTLDGNSIGKTNSRFVSILASCNDVFFEDVEFKNMQGSAGGLSCVYCLDGSSNIRMKRIKGDNIDMLVQLFAGTDGFVLDEFEISRWTTRGVYLRGSGNMATNTKILSGKINEPIIVNGNDQPRQPIAIQRAVAGATGFDEPRHVNGLIYDVHVQGSGVPYVAGVASLATADQISMHYAESFKVVGCRSFDGGDLGFNASLYCTDISFVDCEARRNDTCGLNLGTITSGARRVSVVGGTFEGNQLDANGDHGTAILGGITAVNVEQLTITGAHVYDRKTTKTQTVGIGLQNVTDYHIADDNIVKAATPILLIDSTPSIPAALPLDSDDRQTLSFRNGAYARTAGSVTLPVASGDKYFHLRTHVRVPNARPSAVQTLFNLSSGRIKVDLETDGTLEVQIRSTVGTFETFRTDDPIPLIDSDCGVWLDIEADFDTGFNTVRIGRDAGVGVPTVWQAFYSAASTALQELNAIMNGSYLFVAASITPTAYDLDISYLSVSVGATSGAAAEVWTIDFSAARYAGGDDWSQGDLDWQVEGGTAAYSRKSLRSPSDGVVAVRSIDEVPFVSRWLGSVVEVRGGSRYVWSGSDESAEVVANNAIGTVADATGASGAWIRLSEAPPVYDLTGASVDNSNAALTVFSKSLRAGDLAAHKARVDGYLGNNSGALGNIEVEVLVGGVVLYSDTSGIADSVNPAVFRIDLEFHEETDSQLGFMSVHVNSNAFAADTGSGHIASSSVEIDNQVYFTGTEDTDVSRDLEVTMRWTVAAAGRSINVLRTVEN